MKCLNVVMTHDLDMQVVPGLRLRSATRAQAEGAAGSARGQQHRSQQLREVPQGETASG